MERTKKNLPNGTFHSGREWTMFSHIGIMTDKPTDRPTHGRTDRVIGK